MLYPNNHAVKNSIASLCNHYYAGYPEDRIHSLVMVSGGLDSVAMLANLLQHTKHRVHAHFIEIINHEKRARAEKIAVEKCVNYLLRHYRPFEFSMSVYEMMLGEPKWVGPDASVVMFMASRLNKSLGNTMDMVWTAHLRGPVYEYADAGAVHAASYTSMLKKPLWIMPAINFLKFDLYESIPRELAELTWSCRFPKYDDLGNPVKCNSCHGCAATERISKQKEAFSQKSANPRPGDEIPFSPDMSLANAAQKWPCIYPRHDEQWNVMRCALCENCKEYMQFELTAMMKGKFA